MFEPKTYFEKRAALNEIVLQQMINIVYRSGDENTRAQVSMIMNQFGMGQQRLRDEEANRIIGQFQPEEGVNYANAQTVLDYLKANVGRTYFGVQEHTTAPDGAIGTAGFGTKFKDWVESLPEYDASVSMNMETGFDADTMTVPGQKLPLLVLRYGEELITVMYRGHVSMVVLNLNYIPAEYNWGLAHHYALRGEMYSYRGNLSIEALETLMSQAIAKHTQTPLNKPAPLPMAEELATTGFSQVVGEDVAVEAETTTAGRDESEVATDTPDEPSQTERV